MLVLKNWNWRIEELRITTIAAKVRRYQGQVDAYRRNKLFANNQRQCYRELDQEVERCDDDQPVAEESKQFSGIIWSQSANHKKFAKLLQGLWNKGNDTKQEKIDVTRRYLVGSQIGSHLVQT